jgi:hypothetical protein
MGISETERKANLLRARILGFENVLSDPELWIRLPDLALLDALYMLQNFTVKVANELHRRGVADKEIADRIILLSVNGEYQKP